MRTRDRVRSTGTVGLVLGLLVLSVSVAAASEPDTATMVTITGAERTVAREAQVASDFDGDGFADLAVGVPKADVNGKRDAGSVEIIPGSPDGPRMARRQLLHQDLPGVPGMARRGDQFGFAVATGDIDGDGFADLAVGARYDDEAGRNAGGVTVFYGSRRGLSGIRSERWDQDVPGVEETAERGEQFGWALVVADLNGDGRAELIVGVRGEDVGGLPSAGAVHVFRGTPRGLTAEGDQLWTQDSPGIGDVAEAGDQFGRTLASADLDGDGHGDLAIGAPYESFRGNRTGRVHVLYGSPQGLRAARSQLWDQESPGILGTSDLRDEFGLSLAAGDFDGDGFGDLAVGIWFEDGCWICNEGRVAVLYGSRTGLRAARNQSWTQDSPGIADQADVGDQFGQSLVAGDVTGDGLDDLVVGVPWEDFNDRNVFQDRGALHVLRGSPTGLTARGSRFLAQGIGGVGDRGENDDHFAEALAVADVDGDGTMDLVVGVPWEDLDARDEGLVHVLKGGPTGPGAHGEWLLRRERLAPAGRARAGDRFGWSLGSGLPRTGTPRSCGGRDGGPC